MKEVTLKSGRKVEVKELTGLDEVLAYQYAGKGYDEKNVLGTATMVRSCMAVLSIKSIDDADLDRPGSLEEVLAIMAMFSRKEWAAVVEAYSEVNEDDMGE